MLWRVLDVFVKLLSKAFSIFVLSEHDRASIEDKPPDNQHQVADDENLLGINLMVLVDILVVRINKLDALILL